MAMPPRAHSGVIRTVFSAPGSVAAGRTVEASVPARDRYLIFPGPWSGAPQERRLLAVGSAIVSCFTPFGGSGTMTCRHCLISRFLTTVRAVVARPRRGGDGRVPDRDHLDHASARTMLWDLPDV